MAGGVTADCGGANEPALISAISLSPGRRNFSCTPTVDVLCANIQRANRPYAGWLNAGIALHVPFDDGRGLKTVELTAGIVGPKSRAAETQTWWHRVIGVKPFLGWRHQLPSEPTAQVLFRSQQILGQPDPTPKLPAGFRTDMIWGYGASFGSPLTMAAASMQWRIGRSLPK
ncbi:MAG: DUF2219 family protein, partial [Proteobacteria bacterium]|nr:DUF2219 family protein [Pseudomonadota bacterium]